MTRFGELAGELASQFSSDWPMGSEAFDDLAHRAFELQYGSNAAYRAFCDARGATPDSVVDWREIPMVPASAFKALPIVSGEPAEAEAVFRTSGTTGGAAGSPAERGRHFVLSLELYEASAVPTFGRFLLPDGIEPLLVALVPDPALARDSSLSQMAGLVADRYCSVAGFYFDPAAGLDVSGIDAALSDAAAADRPVLLFGTAFAFVHWIDHVAATGARYELPTGSRIMETGGFKGRSRAVEREELYSRLSEATGIETTRIVNEYGMTEMLSQFYEPVLVRDPVPDALAGRWHEGPPWVRSRVLDPVTLEPLPQGERGILAHFDLANLGSVCAILTEDWGVEAELGFRLLGRAAGAEPRGCSLAMEDFLAAGEKA